MSLCVLMISLSSQSPKIESSFLSLTIPLSLLKSKPVSKTDVAPLHHHLGPTPYPISSSRYCRPDSHQQSRPSCPPSLMLQVNLSTLNIPDRLLLLRMSLLTLWFLTTYHSMPDFQNSEELSSGPTIHSPDLGSSSNLKRSALNLKAIPALAPN